MLLDEGLIDVYRVWLGWALQRLFQRNPHPDGLAEQLLRHRPLQVHLLQWAQRALAEQWLDRAVQNADLLDLGRPRKFKTSMREGTTMGKSTPQYLRFMATSFLEAKRSKPRPCNSCASSSFELSRPSWVALGNPNSLATNFWMVSVMTTTL